MKEELQQREHRFPHHMFHSQSEGLLESTQTTNAAVGENTFVTYIPLTVRRAHKEDSHSV